jgi:hypothetical protein
MHCSLEQFAPYPVDFDQAFEAWLPKLSASRKVTGGLTAGALLQRACNQ